MIRRIEHLDRGVEEELEFVPGHAAAEGEGLRLVHAGGGYGGPEGGL